MASFGKTLHELRRQKGLSQIDIANLMTDAGFPTLNQSVSRWEKDINIPNAVQFLELVKILDIKDVRGTFLEGDKSYPYGLLSMQNQIRVNDYINLLLVTQSMENNNELTAVTDENNKDIKNSNDNLNNQNSKITSISSFFEYKNKKEKKNTNSYAKNKSSRHVSRLRELPLFNMAVSAGFGNELEGTEHDLINVPEGVPDSADFAVKISGNSMEPRFHDGQIIWVHAQDTIENGEFGIFMYDGMAFCKMFSANDNEGAKLVSVNTKYLPKPIDDTHEFKVFGKIVSP
jgi:SOS-response transcriptional repressor LexA